MKQQDAITRYRAAVSILPSRLRAAAHGIQRKHKQAGSVGWMSG